MLAIYSVIDNPHHFTYPPWNEDAIGAGQPLCVGLLSCMTTECQFCIPAAFSSNIPVQMDSGFYPLTAPISFEIQVTAPL